ncbi:MAG TPA: T9SS type A sorting domain-containing protein, partial [Paludibacteraceae bacterium]|nr:T9SS type A sorting domain-containing protein [Paludibacteraceae bacterium]
YSFYEFEVYAPSSNDENNENSVELTKLNFIKLQLFDENNNLLSENFYWRNMDEYNYQDLNTLPKADVTIIETHRKENGKYFVSCVVKNNSSTIAFGNRLKVVNKQTGKRILPIFLNDNYFTLMPNESKNIEIEFSETLIGKDNFEVVLKQYGNYDSTPVQSNVEKESMISSDVLPVYPNPASQVITLGNPATRISEVKIYNIFGSLVHSASYCSIIDISKLSPGIYLVSAIIDNKLYTSRFIKD